MNTVSVKTNPIYPLMTSPEFTNLLPVQNEKKEYHQIIDEKTDTDINELLKGHKSILEEKKTLKKKRITKKTLKNFLSPLQIATYNTYNPTPESLKNLHDKKPINPAPVHHSNHPKNFNLNQYNQKVRNQQISIANAIETAKLLRIVENELNSVKIAKKEKKKEKKKVKKKVKKITKKKDIKKKRKGKKAKKPKKTKKKVKINKHNHEKLRKYHKPSKKIKKKNYFYRRKKKHRHAILKQKRREDNEKSKSETQ